MSTPALLKERSMTGALRRVPGAGPGCVQRTQVPRATPRAADAGRTGGYRPVIDPARRDGGQAGRGPGGISAWAVRLQDAN